eukprot:CCRYP_012200-RA/>CCRYP_012200-RA protein AED:0.00 eAED:0.00 QI:24/1/1/1/0/0/2/78/37
MQMNKGHAFGLLDIFKLRKEFIENGTMDCLCTNAAVW